MAAAAFAVLAVAVGAVSLVGGLLNAGMRTGFSTDACESVRLAFAQRIVGQEFATRQIADAVCDHLHRAGADRKPLILSVHGPPGVGKSFLHGVLADALFLDGVGEDAAVVRTGSGENGEVAEDVSMRRCTPMRCPGYRILFGTSYLSDDAERQFAELRFNLVRHVRAYRESLVVIEEYDKMDCRSRGLLRELVDHAAAERLHWGRSIVLLESNAGYLQLAAGASGKASPAATMTPEAAQKMLKDQVFSLWRAQAARDCPSASASSTGDGDRVDTLKAIGMIDMFVPFFPLGVADIQALFAMLLAQRARFEVRRQAVRSMRWDADVASFLATKVEYEDGFAIEGAKEGRPTMSRHVTRAIHSWNATHAGIDSFDDSALEDGTRLPSIRLRVSRTLSEPDDGDASSSDEATLLCVSDDDIDALHAS